MNWNVTIKFKSVCVCVYVCVSQQRLAKLRFPNSLSTLIHGSDKGLNFQA